MTKDIHSNPWQSSAILRAHALSQIQQQNTTQVIVATAANKLYRSSGVSKRINQIWEEIDLHACFAIKFEQMNRVESG